MHATTIVAYTYRADNYCPTCMVEALVSDGLASPAARDMAPEEVLDQLAGANGIDRYDESSYDSDEFPKVVFADMVSEDGGVEGSERDLERSRPSDPSVHCGRCQGAFLGGCECVSCIRAELVAEVLKREGLDDENDYRSFGKYDSALADALDLADWDDGTTGDTDWFAHYRRFDAALAIVETASSGAVSVTTYYSLDELEKDWQEIERQYEETLVGELDGPYVAVEAIDHELSFRWYPGSSGVHVFRLGRATEIDYWTMGDDTPDMESFVSSVRDHLLCSQ